MWFLWVQSILIRWKAHRGGTWIVRVYHYKVSVHWGGSMLKASYVFRPYCSSYLYWGSRLLRFPSWYQVRNPQISSKKKWPTHELLLHKVLQAYLLRVNWFLVQFSFSYTKQREEGHKLDKPDAKSFSETGHAQGGTIPYCPMDKNVSGRNAFLRYRKRDCYFLRGIPQLVLKRNNIIWSGLLL